MPHGDIERIGTSETVVTVSFEGLIKSVQFYTQMVHRSHAERNGHGIMKRSFIANSALHTIASDLN